MYALITHTIASYRHRSQIMKDFIKKHTHPKNLCSQMFKTNCKLCKMYFIFASPLHITCLPFSQINKLDWKTNCKTLFCRTDLPNTFLFTVNAKIHFHLLIEHVDKTYILHVPQSWSRCQFVSIPIQGISKTKSGSHGKSCLHSLQQEYKPRVHATHNIWRKIQIKWISNFVVIPSLGIRSLQNFAHAMTAVLSWHVQNFVVMTLLGFEWE